MICKHGIKLNELQQCRLCHDEILTGYEYEKTVNLLGKLVSIIRMKIHNYRHPESSYELHFREVLDD